MSGISTDCPSAAAPTVERRLTSVLDLGCRYLLAAIFLMAALGKATDLRGFEDRVLLHTSLPPWAALALARFLPWLELSCGGCLLLRYAVREAALVAALLLLCFLIHGLFAFDERECGCLLFPGVEQVAWDWWQPLRNSLLLLGCVRVVCRGR